MFMPTLFDDFFEEFTRPVAPKHIPVNTMQLMKTDVKEEENGFTLDIEIPGYNKEDLKLELKEGYLNVSAEKNSENKEEKGKYIRRERYFGSVSRSFYVGEEITPEDINAKFENGVLAVFVPKKETQPKLPEAKYIQIA